VLQEEGERGKEFGSLDSKYFESLDIRWSSLPIKVYYVRLQVSAAN
jgi:hypothetical protein